MKIRHPSNDRVRTIDANRFDVYRSQGWVEVKSVKKTAETDDAPSGE